MDDCITSNSNAIIFEDEYTSFRDSVMNLLQAKEFVIGLKSRKTKEAY